MTQTMLQDMMKGEKLVRSPNYLLYTDGFQFIGKDGDLV